MSAVYVVSHNIISPLGSTTAENFSRLKEGVSGIRRHDDEKMSDQPFFASLLDNTKPLLREDSSVPYTKFEQLLIASMSDALLNSDIDVRDKATALIISSTKGNIGLLGTGTDDPELMKRIALPSSAAVVARHHNFINKPIVVSNACISGVLGILTGMRLIRSGQYENVVVAGADTVSKFVLSGFQSFQAISPGLCKPFDRQRDGINLGEGAATIVLSSQKKYGSGIRIASGSVSNDANHISGPSRTGTELFQIMTRSLREAGLQAADIDFISAHGTATVYNDEMEAKAIGLADLRSVPVNSLKGYYGHTLGAAGLIESIITIQSMKEGLILPTMGFEQIGVSEPLNICSSLLRTPLKNCLKTASGFGGCNAAMIMSK
ncbi:MAG TPA: beta-ketoacyl synthase N-terminal-like domain-containing protein [Puia sp.]|nr:beta-ketoacyl synthase N-terminal-like domain-containing protein [Puia sp.]